MPDGQPADSELDLLEHEHGREARDDVPVTRRVERALDDQPVPRTIADAEALLAAALGGGRYGHDTAEAWVDEAARALHGLPARGLPATARDPFRQAVARVAVDDGLTGDLAFATGVRATVARAFAASLGGLVLEGPPWAMGPDEPDRTHYQEVPR